MLDKFSIDSSLLELADKAEKELEPIFKSYEKNALHCSASVLKAFQDNYLSTGDFTEISGYGYSDAGRDKLESVYANIYE